MVFSSMVFLWIFLPVVFVLGAIIRKPKYQNIILLIASLIFYAWGEPRYIFLLLFSIAMNYTFGLLIGEGEPLDSAGKEKSEGTGGKRSHPASADSATASGKRFSSRTRWPSPSTRSSRCRTGR